MEFSDIDTDAIGKPSGLGRCFEKVLGINYRMVFSYDVASLMYLSFLGRLEQSSVSSADWGLIGLEETSLEPSSTPLYLSM